MSEHAPKGPEHVTGSLDLSVEIEKNAGNLKEAAEKAETIDSSKVESIRDNVEDEAVSGKEITVGEKQESSNINPVTKGLKQQAYKKTLKRVRAELPTGQRILSSIIHQPVIEKISNVGAQTVSRPSGIIGGASFALLGSLGLLLAAKHYGFTYNYAVFFVLFVGGFALGLFLELILRIFRPAKHS